MLARPLLAIRLGPLSWLIWTLCLLTATTSAQPLSPLYSVYGMAYATIDENTFYIQGGYIHPPPGGIGTMATDQLFSLDLTQNWDAASPPWKRLAIPSSNFPQQRGHSMTVSPDGQTLSIWLSTTPAAVGNYSIKSDTWTPVPLSPNVTMAGNRLHAVSVPTTGLVYIPLAGLSSNNMARFSFVTGQMTLIDIPLILVEASYSYAAAWCQPRNTIVLFTGNSSNPVPFFEYHIATGKWFIMQSLGKTTPPIRTGSCLVPAYNGTKMVLFGGDNATQISVASISILDIETMVWTNGEDAPDPRSGMACTVAGDNFIVWGGYKEVASGDTIGVPTTPLIYNIKSGKWTDKYIRFPSAGNNTGGGSESGAGSGSGGGAGGGSGGGGRGTGPGGGEAVDGRGSSTNNAAAIGGGVAGAVVVIAVIAGFVIRKRRQHKGEMGFDKAPSKPAMSSMQNSSDGPASNDDFHQSEATFQQQQQPRFISNNNPQYSSRNQLQGDASGNPQAYIVPPRPRRGIVSYQDIPSVPGVPQDYIQQQQHHKEHNLYANYYNNSDNNTNNNNNNKGSNPQYNSKEVHTYSSPSAIRAPQGAADPASMVNNEELLEQINLMQTEWNRRQKRMNA